VYIGAGSGKDTNDILSPSKIGVRMRVSARNYLIVGDKRSTNICYHRDFA
jgi:hypothetical protein